MPWQNQAMKDVASCDKLRGAAHRRYIRRFPNGETHYGKTVVHPAEYIGGNERTEGKERNLDSESSGERNRNSPNPLHFGVTGVVGSATVELPIWWLVESSGKWIHRA